MTLILVVALFWIAPVALAVLAYHSSRKDRNINSSILFVASFSLLVIPVLIICGAATFSPNVPPEPDDWFFHTCSFAIEYPIDTMRPVLRWLAE